LRIRVAALRRKEDVDLTSNIKIVARLVRQASIIGALVAANGPAQFATIAMSAIAAAAAGASSRSKTFMGKPSSAANFSIGPAADRPAPDYDHVASPPRR
jgi:hypothetical protein